MVDIVAARPICNHLWTWVSPAGTKNAARLCQFCHEPNPDWLNHTVEIRLVDCVNGPECINCEFSERDDSRVEELMTHLRPDLMLGMGVSARDNGYEIILHRVSRKAADADVFGGEDDLFASGDTFAEALTAILGKLRSVDG